MRSYMFRQGCRPLGDFRISEIIEFMELMKQAFHVPEVYGANDRPVQLDARSLEKMFLRRKDKLFPTLGVNVHFFSIPPGRRDDRTVRFEICTGNHPAKVFIDAYDVDMGDQDEVPDLSYFERSIEIFGPFEAYLEEFHNERKLDAYNRQQSIPKFDRPAIIRGFHYLDEFMANSIGGIDHCLGAPAWKAERFLDGVLIRLVPGLFDSDNPEHLQIQSDVMDYFDMW